MDGARFANAVAFLGCSPADVTWRAGVDVLSFGATKNGALAAEAVVFFDPCAGAGFRAATQARRAPALEIALRVRAAARLCRDAASGSATPRARTRSRSKHRRTPPGMRLMHPVEANEVFLSSGMPANSALRDAGFEFYDWGQRANRRGALRRLLGPARGGGCTRSSVPSARSPLREAPQRAHAFA